MRSIATGFESKGSTACARLIEEKCSARHKWSHLIKPPNSRCTSNFKKGCVTGIVSEHSILVDGTPRHMKDLCPRNNPISEWCRVGIIGKWVADWAPTTRDRRLTWKLSYRSFRELLKGRSSDNAPSEDHPKQKTVSTASFVWSWDQEGCDSDR